MWLYILELVGGIFLLVFSGKYLVKGGVELTKYFNISKLVVGMTVVAFGTSAPELLVSVEAALKGVPDISLGNVIGSNISNIALVLAFTAVILPIPVKKDTLKFDMPIMMFSFLLLYLFMNNGKLSRLEGLAFLALLVAYIFWEIKHSQNNFKEEDKNTEDPEYKISVAVIVILLSSIGLALGANFLVEGASKIAKHLNIDERVIAISVVAVGTSLPELTTSVIAALRKEMDISIGNIVGSNIFNIFAILGTTAVVKPIEFNSEKYQIDLFIMGLIGLTLWFFILPIFRKEAKFRRLNGIFMLLIYFAYIYFIFKMK